MYGEPNCILARASYSMAHAAREDDIIAFGHFNNLAFRELQSSRAAQHDDPFVIRLIVPVIFRAAVRM